MLPTLTRAHLVLVCLSLCLLTACDDSSASLDQDIDITRDDAGHGGNSVGKGGKGGGGGSASTAKGGSGGSNASSGKPSGGSGGAGGASAGSDGIAANGGSRGASAGASGARAGAGGVAGQPGAGTAGRSGMGGSSISVAGASGHAVAGVGGVVARAGAGATAGHAGAAGMAGGAGGGVARSGPCAKCESDSVAMSCPESLSDCATLSGTTAADSPMPGVPKAALCQMILDCFHTTHCAANFTPTDCLCGAGVAADACMMSKDFAGAKGMCKDLIAAGAETTDMAMIQDRMLGKMYALGPAIAVLQNCDYISCTKECL